MVDENIVSAIRNRYPHVNIFDFDNDELLIYDAKPNFAFLLGNKHLDLLFNYLINNIDKSNVKDDESIHILSLIEKLKERGVFSPGPLDELCADDDASINKKVEYFLENILMRKFVLEVTENCNMRCKYCFNSNESNFRHHRSVNMSLETAKKAIDYYCEIYLKVFKKLSKENQAVIIEEYPPFIGFYGGEPSLNISLIKQATEYFKQKKWEGTDIDSSLVGVTMNTNLFNLNEDELKFWTSNNVTLYVSLDGTKKDHDKNRVDINGKGTFDRVYSNLLRIKEYDPQYFKERVYILAVDADSNDTESNRSFLKSLGCEFSLIQQAYYGCIIHDAKDRVAFIESNIDNLISQRLKTISDCRDDSYILEFEDLFNLDGIVTDDPYSTNRQNRWLNCPMGIDNIMIGVDGALHICHKTDGSMSFGNINQGIDKNLLSELYKKYAVSINNIHCRSCWAHNFCSFCAALRMKDGEFIVPGHDECEFMRSTIKLSFKTFIQLYNKYPNELKLIFDQKNNIKRYKTIVSVDKFNNYGNQEN